MKFKNARHYRTGLLWKNCQDTLDTLEMAYEIKIPKNAKRFNVLTQLNAFCLEIALNKCIY